MRRTRSFFAYLLVAAMIMTTVSQNALPVLAAEPEVNLQSGAAESDEAAQSLEMPDAGEKNAETADAAETGPEGGQEENAEEGKTGQETSGENVDAGENQDAPESENGTENAGEQSGEENADAEESPDAGEESDKEEHPGGEEDNDAGQQPDDAEDFGTEQNPDTEQEPAAEEAETVSGSDLHAAVTETVEEFGISPQTDQGWVGDLFWAVTDGKLEVSGSGDYFASAAIIDAPWSTYASQIKTAEIRLTGMTSTARMFSGCKNLTSITFKDFDTSGVVSMSEMFKGCSSLTSIDLRKFNTENVVSMSEMFEGCSSLTDVDVSGFDLTSATGLGAMFRGCKALRRVDFGQCRAEKLVNMHYMFFGCENLQSVDLSGFRTENVVRMTDMFNECRSLQTINWGKNFNTKSVTNIQGMFTGCSSLTELDLSSFDLSGVTQTTNARYFLGGCYNLDVIQTPYNLDSAVSIALPREQDNWYTEYGVKHTELPHDKVSITLTRLVANESDIASGVVKKIQWRIDAEGNLTVKGTGDFSDSEMSDRAPWWKYAERIKAASVDVKGMTDASFMFADCENLVSLDLRQFDTGTVTNMAYMFYGCSSLGQLDLSRFDTGNVTDMICMFMECRSLTSLDLSSFDTRNVRVMCDSVQGMFMYCENLASLDISSFDTRNVEDDLSWMFSGCKKLKKLDISSLDLRKVYNIAGMFEGCESLEQFDFGVFTNYDGVWDMRRLFYGCKKLKKINTNGFDAGYVSDMHYMFADCSSLTSLALRRTGMTEDSISEMSYMFSGCTSLTNLDLRAFGTEDARDMQGMFQNCGRLAKLDLSCFSTDAVGDMGRMFAGCGSLTTLDLSGFDAKSIRESETLGAASTGVKEMFDGCTKLATLYAPYNMPTDLKAPAMLPGGTWYLPDGTETAQLLSLDHSVKLTKKKPAVTKPAAKASLTVKKTKTAYFCGETVSLADLTVMYYGSDGTAKRVTDYTTNLSEIDVSVPGKKALTVTYQDLTAQVELSFTRRIAKETVTITVPDMVYTGISRMPVPTVKMAIGGKNVTLAYGRDFTTAYTNNVNAGTAAEVTITGINNYSGTAGAQFTILPAAITVRPLDTTLAVGDALPESGDFAYQVSGLYQGDALLTEPSFTCDVTDMSKPGVYTISYVAGSADAGVNYRISGENGTLTVARERISYTVTFDYAGHKAEDGVSTTYVLTDIIAGSRIKGREPKPADKGYLFTGWYKDRAYTKIWDFDTDTVQENLTLYACWLLDAGQQTEGADLCIKEIMNQNYTGSQIKPAVVVYAGDGTGPLKAGRDYTVKYVNNIEADRVNKPGGVSASESEEDGGFTKELAYVVITGKGNYTGTVCRNFHIEPASVGDGGDNTAQGFTLKYTGQMTVNAKKAQKPFASLKYKKAMKAGKDYDVKLTATAAYDADGDVVEEDRAMLGETGGSAVIPVIPAGWRGAFLLTVTGKGNYSGFFTKSVCVADKSKLMKNASVTLGKNMKSIEYTGKDIILTPAWYDASRKKYYEVDNEGAVNRRKTFEAADVFTVKIGKEYLRYGKDFSVSYSGNRAVGTAVLTISGEGDYSGEKSVTFKIRGTAFNTKNVILDAESFQTAMSYTGNALTQNGVILTKAADAGGEKLVYGRDYSISYKNNRKKGTATMTFTANAASGYTGNFKKTFKITAADLNTSAAVGAEEDGQNLIEAGADGSFRFKGEVPYAREGAKPAGRIRLTNQTTGEILKEGTDYTVGYANHKTLTGNAAASPVMTLKGKGNYAGTVKVYYQITEAQWSLSGNPNLHVDITPVAYDGKKDDTYAYVPKIRVTDGKAVLKVGKDYEVEAYNCTQDKISAYLKTLNDLQAGTSSVTQETLEQMKPYVVLAAVEGSGYKAGIGLQADVTVYQNKLTQNSLYVVVSGEPAQTTYSGEQLRPGITVYYGDAAAIRAAKKDGVTEESLLTSPNGQYGLTKLRYSADGSGDYTLTYGSNVTAGKNKGSVTVKGTGLYGGSVTVKFTIWQKDVYKI